VTGTLIEDADAGPALHAALDDVLSGLS